MVAIIAFGNYLFTNTLIAFQNYRQHIARINRMRNNGDYYMVTIIILRHYYFANNFNDNLFGCLFRIHTSHKKRTFDSQKHMAAYCKIDYGEIIVTNNTLENAEFIVCFVLISEQ